MPASGLYRPPPILLLSGYVASNDELPQPGASLLSWRVIL